MKLHKPWGLGIIGVPGGPATCQNTKYSPHLNFKDRRVLRKIDASTWRFGTIFFQWLFSKFALGIILASNQEFIIDYKSGKIVHHAVTKIEIYYSQHIFLGYCTS